MLWKQDETWYVTLAPNDVTSATCQNRITDILASFLYRGEEVAICCPFYYAANDDCNCTTQCISQKWWAPCDNSPRCFLCMKFYCFSEDALAKCCCGWIVLTVDSFGSLWPVSMTSLPAAASQEHTGLFISWRGRGFLQGFKTELTVNKANTVTAVCLSCMWNY